MTFSVAFAKTMLISVDVKLRSNEFGNRSRFEKNPSYFDDPRENAGMQMGIHKTSRNRQVFA